VKLEGGYSSGNTKERILRLQIFNERGQGPTRVDSSLPRPFLSMFATVNSAKLKIQLQEILTFN